MSILQVIVTAAGQAEVLPPGTPYIMTIDTTRAMSGQANTEFKIQLQGNGTSAGNRMTIDWGDGNTTTAISGLQTYNYAAAGNYTVEIVGYNYQTPLSFSIKSQAKVTDITQWGNHQYHNMNNFLYLAGSGWNGAMTAADTPTFRQGADLFAMFGYCYNFSGSNTNIDKWNMTNVESVSFMFSRDVNSGASIFNANISGWDTSTIKNFSFMFTGATSFNQNLNNWNMGNATTTTAMFQNARVYNQPMNNWNTANVTSMTAMFNGANVFNQDLSQWCVSNFISKPNNFDTGTTAWTLPKPVWGTCPV